ncbi:hypothetical protein COLO4_33164 [Corchorus olitorius]|uniref:RRM domain-containing protein n=1 Tax=Corchorus olitorius TaxID=93759 RepID=A0A1R3GVU4_9ROSI|nr:hypothetical protein COLO4_33164 [Corchorus olitorius]
MRESGSRVGGRRISNWARRQLTESFRWRLSLHAVYVSNLSNMVSKKAIWEIFNDFGVVVDVFLSNRKQNGSSCFAFVSGGGQVNTNFNPATRFNQRNVRLQSSFYENRRRFVPNNRERGQRMVRGRSQVRRMFHRVRREDRRHGQSPGRKNGVLNNNPRSGGEDDAKDDSSPVEPPKNDTIQARTSIPIDNALEEEEVSSDESNDVVKYREDVVMDIHIPEVDMLWLERSIIVVLNSDGNLTEAIHVLSKMDLIVQIRELSTITLLLTVEEASLVDVCIGMVNSFDGNFISTVESWEFSSTQRSSLVWVLLEEVPLELWHENFFTALCNDWGKLVKIDDITLRRESLKFARCQVLISSLSDIPKLVVGTSMDIKFKIHVTVEKDAELVPMVSQEDNCTPALLFYASQDDLSPPINELALNQDFG